jgi:hypothetical protein
VIGEISLVLIVRMSTESRFDFNDLQSTEQLMKRDLAFLCFIESAMFYRIVTQEKNGE